MTTVYLPVISIYFGVQRLVRGAGMSLLAMLPIECCGIRDRSGQAYPPSLITQMSHK